MTLDTSMDSNKSDHDLHFDLDQSVNEPGVRDHGHHYSETGHDDRESVPEPRLRDLPLTVWNIPRFIVLGFIRLYQITLSRALPPGTCRFYPTCSHYGYQAIYKYGVLKGGIMATWRILRCNPFNPGGFDPVS